MSTATGNRLGFGLSAATAVPLLLPLLGLILSGGALAQQAPVQEPKAAPSVAAAPAKPQTPAQGQSKPSQAPSGGDAGLKARIESLEVALCATRASQR